jgi:hypothetical protein
MIKRIICVAWAMTLCGCALTYQTYDKPVQRRDERAVIHKSASIVIRTVDGCTVPDVYALNILPGEHALEVAYYDAHRVPARLAFCTYQVQFTAEGGHSYRLSADADDFRWTPHITGTGSREPVSASFEEKCTSLDDLAAAHEGTSSVGTSSK